jgi:hypothetical protein
MNHHSCLLHPFHILQTDRTADVTFHRTLFPAPPDLQGLPRLGDNLLHRLHRIEPLTSFGLANPLDGHDGCFGCVLEIQHPRLSFPGPNTTKGNTRALPALWGDFLLMNLAWIATKEGPTKPFG